MFSHLFRPEPISGTTIGFLAHWARLLPPLRRNLELLFATDAPEILVVHLEALAPDHYIDAAIAEPKALFEPRLMA